MNASRKPAAAASAAEEASPSVATLDRGRLIGLAILAIIVVFVAAWMAVRGRAALAAPVAKPAPHIEQSERSRFDANAWNLPSEALLGFVEIPAGEFVMGSDPAVDPTAYENERWSGAQKQGHIELPAFYIGRYEVTVVQFAAFVADTGRVVDTLTLRAPGEHPVTNVTWPDALAYARWLESQLKASTQTPAALAALLREGWHVSLPSEAQWEKAARGSDGRRYPWGNTADDRNANYGRSGTMPVGSLACPACAFGLADMSGNVWELTRSPFQPYPYESEDAARDPRADALFVMRGGAFNDGPSNVRAAVRGGIDPGVRRPFIGFRIVLNKTS